MHASRMTSALALTLLTWACGSNKPSTEQPEDNRPPGVVSAPSRLAWTCVAPGCDETQQLTFTVLGTRRAAIKRILLSGGGAADFSFTSSEEAPFTVGAGSSFTVDVRYVPKGAPPSGPAELRVTFTDALAEESEDRLVAGETVVPLVRRIVGEALLVAEPETLKFGAVGVGASQTLPLRVSNGGFGNISLQLLPADGGHPEVQVQWPTDAALAPDAGVEVPVTWTPAAPAYLSGELVLRATAEDVVPVTVKLEGTSLPEPRLGVEPQATVDFGTLAKGKTKALSLVLKNRGGRALTFTAITVQDILGNVKVTAPATPAGLSLQPLESLPLQLLVDAKTAGAVDARVRISSNDASAPVTVVKVTGTVTEPRVALTPTALDYGVVPLGWVMNKPVEVKNVGYGTLTVKNISLVGGSSQLFSLLGLPSLPLTLERNARASFQVEFRAEAPATVQGTVVVETDDATTPFAEVELDATVGTCAQGCPIANGTASCSSGKCEVGTCNAGWYNTDGLAASGCECQDTSNDPGEFCADAQYAGNLPDNGASATWTGLLPITGDVDLIKFHANDNNQFFYDDFDVRISLSSADPGISLCIYRHGTADGENDCFFTEETCPADRQYRKDGSFGTEDGADFVLKVFRTASSVPACIPYTVFMRNG
ncbi:MAG: choice-of-anchor D domain-containing protein [Deltaproteobacteria bacterium]|nr:choice-of-anchor D domain-containing protein [Deltaproteobacteria bacterium]